MPYERETKTATITEQNTFTEWANVQGVFQIHISGLTDSTLTFQGSPDAGDTIYDLETFSDVDVVNTIHVGTVAITNWVYRIGCKTGDYGTDTVLLRLEK